MAEATSPFMLVVARAKFHRHPLLATRSLCLSCQCRTRCEVYLNFPYTLANFQEPKSSQVIRTVFKGEGDRGPYVVGHISQPVTPGRVLQGHEVRGVVIVCRKGLPGAERAPSPMK